MSEKEVQMKKLMLLALVLAVAPTYQAQVVTAMPRAHLFVIDANSKLVGYAAVSEPTAGSTISVTIGFAEAGARKLDSIVLRMIWAPVSGHQRYAWADDLAYFEGANCTGPAYRTWSTAGPSGRRLGTIMDGNILYVSDPDPGLVTAMVASSKIAHQTCQPYGPTTIQAIAIHPTIGLDTVWQGPFRTY
jgi:hypothetical protein